MCHFTEYYQQTEKHLISLLNAHTTLLVIESEEEGKHLGSSGHLQLLSVLLRASSDVTASGGHVGSLTLLNNGVSMTRFV